MMKTPLIAILILFTLPFSIHAQSSYSEAIQQGDAAYNRGQYKLAINKYFAAEAFDPSKDETVKAKVNRVFDRIEQLRQEADEAKEAAEKAKIQTLQALDKANKLIDAFYFYADRFALAYGEKEYWNVFYFIDKEGNEIEKLGRWQKAEQFDWTGFAKVKKEENGKLTDYLLDTLGNFYRTAYDLSSLTSEVTALDLSNERWDSFPAKIFEYPQLEVLLINGHNGRENALHKIPDEIGRLNNLKVLQLTYDSIDTGIDALLQLSNLKWLDLSLNQLTELPGEIGNLSNLEGLFLNDNRLEKLPPEFGKLSKLEWLNLSLNQLTELPLEIGKLSELKWLDLSANRLRKLPGEIGKLLNLETLYLTFNQLQELPPDVWTLFKMKWLYLSINELKELPPEVGMLSNLVGLDLSFNRLTKLPMEISKLSNLKWLDASDNQLTELPLEMETLINLERLYLNSTKLSEEQINKIKTLLPNCKIEF